MIIPNTQQSMLLLCISLAVLGFFLGIEVQKRRLGSMGALASTINIIVLDNPMTFHFSQFLDSALGQIVGCVLAFTVICWCGINRATGLDVYCLISLFLLLFPR